MPIPTTLRYVFDRTGVSVDNLVISEPHTLPAKEQRAFAPLHGAFYYESLKIRERNTGRELIKGIDYVGIQYYKIPSTMTGKEVYAVILVKDEAMTTEIEIDYQVVGGEFSYSNDSIARFLNELDEDGRSVNWNEILHKPDQFDAAPHYTDIGDIYGFEYVIQALEQLRSAILIGDRVAHDELYKYVNALGDRLTDTTTAIRNDLAAHTNDGTNPHNVTKAQVGLGNVENYGIATNAEALAGTVNNKYMTPLRVKEAIAEQAGKMLNAHIADKNNPHNVTKTQVGLSEVMNYGVASLEEAIAGLVNNKYMTPYLTKRYSDNKVMPVINTHIANKNNPHGVTKAQVGLSLVENFGIATTAEAQAGTATNKYTVPAHLKAYADSKVMPTINNHIANRSNPHAVTKAQVGLGNVDNTSDANKPVSNAVNVALGKKLNYQDASLGTTNINTIKTQGLYNQNANVNATAALGYPVQEAGLLLVSNGAYGCQQVYFPFNTAIFYVRAAQGTGWIPWRRSGDWNNIVNKPSVFPTNWASIQGKPSVFPTNWSQISGKPNTLEGYGIGVNNIRHWVNQVYSGTGPIIDVTQYSQLKDFTFNERTYSHYLRFHFANGSTKDFLIRYSTSYHGGNNGGGNYA